jgi:tetratricopeptide (TPR) repeat protein
MNYYGSPDQQLSTGTFPARTRKVFITLLIMASINATYAQSPEIRKAYRYLDIEQPSKFMPALQQAVGDDPENLYHLGLGYIITGDLEKALSTFEKGIDADKKNPLPVAGKGHVKLLQKKTAEGKALLAEAADMNRKKTAEQWTAIGRAYLSDTKFLLDAIAAFEKAKDVDNGNPVTHVLLGDAYLMQNNGGEAVSSYERAVSADPQWAKPLYKIAKVFQRSQNDDIVMDYLTRAVKVDPQYAPAWRDLGEEYYKQKKASAAVDAYEKYLSISEKPGDAKYQLGFFYMMDKNYQKATEIFGQVLNDKNATPTALKFYAFALMEQNKDQEAIKILEQYFQKADPKDIKAADYVPYGKLLIKLGQDSLANEVFARGIKIDTAKQEIELHELQAETYRKRQKFAEAAQAYKELIEAKEAAERPVSPYDLFWMGWTSYYDTQFFPADSAFTKVTELQPESSLGYLWAAKARVQIDTTGAQGLAVPMYEKYLELALANPESQQKEKKNIIEAYEYLGQYALHHKDNVAEATSYFQKVLELDPKNERANEFMNTIKELNRAQSPPRGGR